jgi:hypothetical protein
MHAFETRDNKIINPNVQMLKTHTFQKKKPHVASHFLYHGFQAMGFTD